MLRTALFGMSLLLISTPALAQTDADTQQIMPAVQQRLDARGNDVVAVIRGEKNAADVFSDAFLAEVPPEKFAEFSEQVQAQFGPVVGFEGVSFDRDGKAIITILFERATGSGAFMLQDDAFYRVSGLVLDTFHPVEDSPEKLVADLARLRGKTAAWFGPIDGSRPLFSHNAAAPMAIGSTFKLYVLAAVTKAVADGHLEWDGIVPLTVKSFAGGTLYGWPDGAPLTIQTAASLMISQSDNTATDLLIDAVGRAAVESQIRASEHSDPDAMLPILDTYEIVALKAREAGARYGNASEEEQRKIAASITREPITAQQVAALFGGDPVRIDAVEWFASMNDQRNILRHLLAMEDQTALAILGINPGLGSSALQGWKYAGYKGGSEPGVLNLAWLLQSEEGTWYMLGLSRNDAAGPVDTAEMEMLATRILALAN